MKILKRIGLSISRNLWALFIFILSFVMILSLIWPDFSFSQTENRKLASLPSISLKGLWNGDTQNDFESYMQDQFPGRDLFFHLNYLVRKFCGQSEINQVYLGHGQLFNARKGQTFDVLISNAKALNRLNAATGIPVSAILCPNAATVLKERLPYQATVLDEWYAVKTAADQFQNVQYIDLSYRMEKVRNDYIFYKTDHHWTSEMAGLAAGEYMSKQHPEDGFTMNDFEALPVSNDFMGSLASASGSCFLKDTIEIRPWKQQQDYPYTVKWADGSVTASVYQTSALSQKNQYEVFLGSNQSLIQIDTMADNDRNLLILKDSYANSMIQFLLPYYRSITIVDPRYCMEDLSKIISRYGINEILAVYSCDTLMSDSSLSVMCDEFPPVEQTDGNSQTKSLQEQLAEPEDSQTEEPQASEPDDENSESSELKNSDPEGDDSEQEKPEDA